MTDERPLAGLSADEKRALLAGLLREKAAKSKATAPMSYGQRALWFLQQLSPDNTAYHIAFSARIRSTVDVAALKRALQTLTNRHAALRTAFPMEDGTPVQSIQPYRDVTFEEIDASGWDDAKLYEQVTKVHQQPFDFDHGPLIRWILFSRAANDHVLLMAIHHIIFDNWSNWVVIDELRQLYQAEAAGQPITLAAPEKQYTDYVQWQNDMLAAPEGAELKTYWQQQLQGATTELNLPTDRPYPLLQTYNGDAVEFRLDDRTLAGMRALAQAEGVTLYMLMLAAFQILLYRYSGQDDILVGSPTSGRSRAEFSSIVGYFVNPVVMRARLSDELPFRDFLQQVRQTVLGALAHQDYPFILMVEEIAGQRNFSRSPLFQVMFNLLKLQRMGDLFELLMSGDKNAQADFGGLALELYAIPQQEGQFDLSLDLLEVGDMVRGTLKYNTDLFDAATVQRFQTHLITLLESIIANPTQKLIDLPILSAAERQHILTEWNNTAVDYPQNVCLHQLFEAQVERTPDATAVVFEGQKLTYHELNERANQLASHLRSLGVKPDTLVGVSMERSLEMVISLYAILKAGGAYVPMDPEYPPARLAYMLQDSNVGVLLTQQRLVTQLPQHQAKVICVDSDWDAIAKENRTNPPLVTGPDNLAYMIYTSGSTGNPKGAMNAHRGIVNRLLWMQDAFKLNASDRIMQKTPFSFDVSVWEFFWPLLTGAQLVVARPGGHRDPSYLVNLIVEQGITTLHFVPSMLELFLKEPEVAKCTSLRRVICSGEALPLELQNRFFERLSAELHNLYGPTEAAVDVTWWACDRQTTLCTVPIGKPIANTQMYILDTQMQPVPVGVGGELHIGGVQVGKGYLNRSDLTASKFIPDPFSSRPDAKLYKTGDLARYLPDGNIEYLGRIDFQVKLRGFRIELGEIESALTQHPGVREALVMLREDMPGDKRLVGYLVATPAPSPADLRTELKGKLPEYMIPAAFVMLDAMPLSPNGKADRKALPKPDYSQLERKQAPAAAQTPTEQMVMEVWQEVLGFQGIGVYDNFFDLGGHSLQAIEVIGKMTNKTGVKIDPAMIRFQTLGQLAASYDEQIANRAATPEPQAEAEGGLTQKFFKAFKRGK